MLLINNIIALALINYTQSPSCNNGSLNINLNHAKTVANPISQNGQYWYPLYGGHTKENVHIQEGVHHTRHNSKLTSYNYIGLVSSSAYTAGGA